MNFRKKLSMDSRVLPILFRVETFPERVEDIHANLIPTMVEIIMEITEVTAAVTMETEMIPGLIVFLAVRDMAEKIMEEFLEKGITVLRGIMAVPAELAVTEVRGILETVIIPVIAEEMVIGIPVVTGMGRMVRAEDSGKAVTVVHFVGIAGDTVRLIRRFLS